MRRSTIWKNAAICLAVLLSGAPVGAEEVQSSVGLTLRLLEAGRFERGDRDTQPGFGKDHAEFNTAGDEAPRHAVVLTKPFYLATTEVTVAQFRQFVEATGYKSSAENNPRGAVGWDPRSPQGRDRYVATFRDGDEFDWKNPGFKQGDNHPVVGVSFADAQAFCAWLSQKEGVKYRLPTEAEWEYAARAGTQTYFSFGDRYRGEIQRHANLGNVEFEKAFPDRVRRQWLVDIDRDPPDEHIFTAPVGSYAANPWGLCDMHGNVWEWCADRYLDTAYTPFDRGGYQQVRKRAIDPLNETLWGDAGDWRVIRGGSWFNSPIQCRSGVRGYFEAGDAACYIGFRVARDATAEQIAAARERFDKSEAARAALEKLVDRVQERRDGRLTLDISQRQGPLSSEFFAALAALDEPIDIYLDGRGELTPKQLAGIAGAPHLRGLVLSNIGPGISDGDLAVLTKHPQLELLQLSGAPKLTDGLFAHLQKLEQLEMLQLDAPEISDDGLRTLPALRRLKTLRVQGTASQGLVLERLAGAPLEAFACNRLTDAGANLLGRFPTLREVSLASSPLGGPGLAEIARLPQLANLDLSRCANLTDGDFAALSAMYDLGYLQLDATAAGDQAAAALAKLNNLQQLQIGSEHLTDAGLRALCGIVSLRGLTINAEAQRLTDAGLADLWRLVNLQRLTLAAPQITGSGLATLAELPALEELGLASDAITDAACEHAAKSTSLRRLLIGNWQHGGPPALTDAALVHLAASPSLKQFELIRKRTSITDEAAGELRRQRPEMSVNLR